MILRLNQLETDAVESALKMSELHYRGRMAEAENEPKAFYDRMIETIKVILCRIEVKKK